MGFSPVIQMWEGSTYISAQPEHSYLVFVIFHHRRYFWSNFFHTKGLGGDPSCGCHGKRKFDLKVFFYPLWSPDLSFWCCWESAARTGKSPSSYWSIRYEWREGWSGRSRKGVIFYLSKKVFTNPASGMGWTVLVRLWQILKGGARRLQSICSAHVDLQCHLGNEAFVHLPLAAQGRFCLFIYKWRWIWQGAAKIKD